MAKQPSKLGVIVGGSRLGNAATGAITHSLDMLDLDGETLSTARIPLTFLAHGFALHPTERRRAVVLEKRGAGAASVDLVSREVLGELEPMTGHHFYGHGSFTADGGALLAIETELATNAGVISIRDPRSFAVIDRFPTYGEAPHDCCLVDGGKTLAITNAGGAVDGAVPCVSFVEVANRKLVDKFEVGESAINTGHIAVARDREFIVVSAPREGLPPEASVGGVSIRRLARPFAYMREPRQVTDRLIGESLSVCIHEPSRTALTTHPYGNLITVWNLDHAVIYAALELAHARGVTLTLDKSRFIVSFGADGGLLALDAHPFKLTNWALREARSFSGSHIYTWDPGLV